MQKRGLPRRDYLLRVHGVSAIINVAIIFELCLIIMSYSYKTRKDSVLSANYLTANEINQRFEYKFDDLWKLYRPFFSKNNRDDGVLEAYQEFATASGAIEPLVRSKLVSSLRTIVAMDSDIASVSLYRCVEPDALYVFYAKADVLKDVSREHANEAEQTILASAEQESGIRILRGGYYDETMEEYCYMIGGNLPSGENGSLIVSYSTANMKNLYRRSRQDISPRILILTQDGEVIFDSEETLYGRIIAHPQERVKIGSREYEVQRVNGSRFIYSTYALTSVEELHQYASAEAPVILTACSLFAGVSLALYALSWRRSSGRVHKISDGIRNIGNLNLNFRFEFSENQRDDEFTSIERAINSMAEDIQRYIAAFKKASKQRVQAEMNKLQSESNPHFLLNTMEMLRTKMGENGEEESMEMLRMLSYILQNHLKGKRFVTIYEEITLLNIYIDFYRLRYGDTFSVSFDIASNIGDYGIVRNLLQPMVENYFVHGFDSDRTDNELRIEGYMNREGFIVINVENNGSMISVDRLREIRAQLETEDENAGFGLRNVSMCLNLFYGKGSYLKIDSISNHTRIQIVMRPMTLEEHERSMDGLKYDE